MGKASSSKKVARAARAGGRSSSGPKRQLGYPLAIAAIVVVGVLVVAFARSDSQEAAAQSPTVGEHWHAAYGIFVCDTFLPDLNDVAADTTGLHTHGDGLAHLHPFNNAAAGDNATLAKWGDTTGVEFGDGSFTVDGTEYADGYDCNGQPAEVALYVWSADDPGAEPEVITGDIGDFHFGANRLAVTLAVVPPGTDVPQPTTLGDLDRLDPVTDEVVPETPTTVAGTTDTTAAGATDTTAPAPGQEAGTQ